MTKRPVINVAASVHQLLKNEAESSGQVFNDLLQHYGLERFLYRLSKSNYSEQFVLKGALLMRVWQLSLVRPTRDIDLLGKKRNEVDSIASVIRDVCNVAVDEDGLLFDAETVKATKIIEDAEYEGLRVEFTGHLGKALIPMQVDIGFGDQITPAPETIKYPVILDMDAPRLQAYPPETSIAEKFQVMLHRGELNSRMKDYFDIWVLLNSRIFQGAILAKAIRKTCNHRNTPVDAQPFAFSDKVIDDPSKQSQWSAFRRRLRGIDTPEFFADVAREIVRFLGPIAEVIASKSPFEKTWNPGGPWF